MVKIIHPGQHLFRHKHSKLKNLTNDDHAQYILVTGARDGASSQIQIFTNGMSDGILSIASGSIINAINGTFSGTVTGGTLTDGHQLIQH